MTEQLKYLKYLEQRLTQLDKKAQRLKSEIDLEKNQIEYDDILEQIDKIKNDDVIRNKKSFDMNQIEYM